jgi:hypothetical protein
MNFTEQYRLNSQCRLVEMGLINQYKELENGIFKERLKHKILHIYWVLSKQDINHDCIMLIFGQINYIRDLFTYRENLAASKIQNIFLKNLNNPFSLIARNRRKREEAYYMDFCVYC